MSAYSIIDADTHVTETPELWTVRAPARMRDRVRESKSMQNGIQRWVFGHSKGLVLGSDNRDLLTNPGVTEMADPGSFKNPPKSYQEIHPGAYDPKARLKYMDEMGIWARLSECGISADVHEPAGGRHAVDTLICQGEV
jgi:uncharacterized protein